MGPVLLLDFDMHLGQAAGPACFQAAGLRERQQRDSVLLPKLGFDLQTFRVKG